MPTPKRRPSQKQRGAAMILGRTLSLPEKPSLVMGIENHKDGELRDLASILHEYLGVGIVIQDEAGRNIAYRLKNGGAAEPDVLQICRRGKSWEDVPASRVWCVTRPFANLKRMAVPAAPLQIRILQVGRSKHTFKLQVKDGTAWVDVGGGTTTLTPHHETHQDGGTDEMSVDGLSGELADPQNVNILKGGVAVGTERGIDFIEGSGVTITATDVPASDKVTVEIASTASGPDPSATVADLDGTGDAGASDDYSRGDHKHGGTMPPADHSHTHASTTGQTANDHHNQAHTIGSATDHTDTDAASPAEGELLIRNSASKWANGRDVVIASDVAGYANALTLTKRMTTSAADGDGPSLAFNLEDAETSPSTNLASIGAYRDGADNSGKLQINIHRAGASTYPMKWRADGSIEVWNRAGTTYLDLLPNLRAQLLLETILERLLRGQLTDGGTATITYTFGSAPSNNSVGTWGGSGWSLSAGYRATNTDTDTFTFVVNLPYAGAVTFDRGTAVLLRSSTVQIAVDGGAPITWDQNTLQTKATAVLAAGPHSIVVTATGAGATVCSLAGVSYGGYAYAGQGGPGDAFTIALGLDYLLAHSLGIGPNNDGATNWSTAYAPAISPRTPMGSTSNDLTLRRTALATATMTFAGVAMLEGHPCVHGYTGYEPFYAGLSLSLSSTAGTRGYRITSGQYGMVGELLTTAAIHDNLWAALVRIDTPGAGSAFSAGDLAVLVVNLSYTSANAGIISSCVNSVYHAADLYKIPADLL